MEDLNQAAEKNLLPYQDWRAWAEINYLDSPTEYREYLPTSPNQNPVTRAIFVPCASKLPPRGRTWIFRVITVLVVALITRTPCTFSRISPKNLSREDDVDL
jgi:hypothetical protein